MELSLCMDTFSFHKHDEVALWVIWDVQECKLDMKEKRIKKKQSYFNN